MERISLFKNVNFEEINNKEYEEELSKNPKPRKSLEMKKSIIDHINKVDLLVSDIETAKMHGEAKRLLKIDKDALKNSQGNFN